MGVRSIRLYSNGDSEVIAANDVYFTFASGRLSYDCVECGAKCCRGYGFMAAPNALRPHFESRRALPLFVDPGSLKDGDGRAFTVANCAPSCFFLSEAGLCDIHARDGYAAKPETCRLFPFNNFRRVGSFLLVEPHRVLCPLQVTPHHTLSNASQHDALIDAMSAQGIAARVPRYSAGTISASEAIDRERTAMEQSEVHMVSATCMEFLVDQLRLEQPALDECDARRLVDETMDLICALFDLPAGMKHLDEHIGRTMIALTPFLRAQFAFARSDMELQEPLARECIPHAVACMYVFANAAQAAGMRSITFQTVSKLVADLHPIAFVLAQHQLRLTWRNDAAIDISCFETDAERRAYLRIAKAFLSTSQRRHAMNLGRILLEHARLIAEHSERVFFLKKVARLLCASLASPGSAAAQLAKKRRRGALRRSMQRWALANVDETRVLAAYDRA